MNRTFKIVAYGLLMLLLASGTHAQKKKEQAMVCRTGLTYEISQKTNWGKGKPVVINVTPYSSAERAGLQLNDIIEEIDGIPTTELSKEDIDILLNPTGRPDIILTLKSAQSAARTVRMRKECKPIEAVTEAMLAMSYNMYSLETTSERTFTCPFTYTATEDTVDLTQFYTFSFAEVDENNRDLEIDLNRIIEREMEKKGYERDLRKPDLLVQTFYYFDKNPDYMGPNPIKLEKPVFRYNLNRNRMEQVPFLELGASTSEAPYLLQLGFRLIDQKLQPGRVLWECESNELLQEPFGLKEYAQMHIPLMCMQFPYLRSKKHVRFTVTQCMYNYTGINYDLNKLSNVAWIDKGSPAYEAGIQPGDVVEGIEGLSTDYTIDEFTAAYRQFVMNTMEFRDKSTRFTDSHGFDRCMYWDTFKYPEVNKAIQNANNLTAFAYLYYFAPYINPTSNNAITFYVKQGEERRKIIIRPTIRSSVSIAIGYPSK